MDWCATCFDELRADGTCAWCSIEPPESQSVDLPAGTDIDGRYLIGRVLGRGGFGITYLGWQQMPGRKVAIKEYLPGSVATRSHSGTNVVPYSTEALDEFNDGLVNFMEEAQRLATFHGDPHIISVFDYVRDHDTAYMIMEYCPGQSALDYLEAAGRRITFDAAMHIVGPTLDALEAVHARQIFHRDVSPDNILLTERGVKLIDFGAARLALRDRSMSFSAVLKLDYAPPEQYTRKGRQGPWTDVYATGATLYHLLCGEPPPSAMDRLQRDELQTPRALALDLPPQAEQALLTALSLDIRQRFQTASDFRRALDAAKTTPSLYQPVAPPVVYENSAQQLRGHESPIRYDYAGQPSQPVGLGNYAPVSRPHNPGAAISPRTSPRTVGKGPWIAAGIALATLLLVSGIVYFLVAGQSSQGEFSAAPPVTNTGQPSGSAQGAATRQAEDDLSVPINRLEEVGFESGRKFSTMLRETEQQSWRFEVVGGTEYAFVAACDHDCTEINLTVARNGVALATRRGTEQEVAAFVHRPTDDSSMSLQLRMGKCSVEPCAAVIQTLSRSSTQ